MIDSSVVDTNALGIERGKIGFAFATNLKKITIPDTVVKIYDGAFIGCYSLTEIIIPDSVREIGTYAFLGATELEKIVFPENLLKGGVGGFSFCFGLKEVECPKMEILPMGMFMHCPNLEKVIIPEGVKTVSMQIFFDCTGLKEVVLPETLEEIEVGAFNGCTGLKTVYNLSALKIEAGSEEYGGVARYAENVYTEYPLKTEPETSETA